MFQNIKEEYKTEVIRNPVTSSPWVSRAPLGYSSPLVNGKKPWLNTIHQRDPYNRVSNVKVQDHHAVAHCNRTAMQESSLLKNLNKSTLILSFPNVHPNKIETVLSLCDNNLSICIGLLRQIESTQHNDKKIIRKRYHPYNIKPVTHKPTIVHRNSNETLMYVPTKDPDVQIIEVVKNPKLPTNYNSNNYNSNNNLAIMEVNNDVMNMLNSCNTVILPPPLIPTTVLGPDENILSDPLTHQNIMNNQFSDTSNITNTSPAAYCVPANYFNNMQEFTIKQDYTSFPQN